MEQSNRKDPGQGNIEYFAATYCGKDGEYHQTRNMEEYDSQKVTTCRCEGYCLFRRGPLLILIIVIAVYFLWKYTKKHKSKK